MQMWPIQLRINELPSMIRYNYFRGMYCLNIVSYIAGVGRIMVFQAETLLIFIHGANYFVLARHGKTW